MTAPVGVVVPARGASPFLAQALDSALAQDPPPAAVVVVDDASPSPLRLDPRHERPCTLLRREHQGGPAAARATALAALDTQLIALLDSDDLWRPGKLRAQVASMDAHPEAAVCFGRAVVIGPDGRPTGSRLEEVPEGVLDGDYMARVLFERNPVPTSSGLVRREPLLAAGGFEGAATDDWGCWMRLAESGASFYFDPSVEVGYRRHPGGETADITKVARIALAIQDAHGEHVDAATRARLRRDYLCLLARGQIRQRRYAEARSTLREASSAAPLRPRERALGALAAVPGLRAALGRRDPFGSA